MDTNYLENNYLTLVGKVTSEKKFSHEIYGERFYSFDLSTPRLSGNADIIPVTVSERLINDDMMTIGTKLLIKGQFRSYNSYENEKNRLILTVFAKDIEKLEDAVEEAEDLINLSADTDIQGFDIDDNVIKIARSNAANAGVDKLIHFQSRSVAELSHHKKYGFIITNPPYGERLEDKETLPAIYSAFGKQYAKLDSWSAYMITSYDDAEKYFGRKADKNRKIYNGMLKTYFYSFMGPKPPKKG